jgi:hypothetical protein
VTELEEREEGEKERVFKAVREREREFDVINTVL